MRFYKISGIEIFIVTILWKGQTWFNGFISRMYRNTIVYLFVNRVLKYNYLTLIFIYDLIYLKQCIWFFIYCFPTLLNEALLTTSKLWVIVFELIKMIINQMASKSSYKI